MNAGADRFTSVKRFALALAAGVVLPLAAAGQTSPWQNMTLAGAYQGWNPTGNNMTLVSNNTWEVTQYFIAPFTNKVKFVANKSWANNWGVSGSPILAAPVSATGVVNGADINFASRQDGYYRFRFNDSTRQFWIDLVSNAIPENVNLLRNPGFETAGSSDFDALHWENGNPDTHGGKYGNSQRANWRSNEGLWIAAVGSFETKFGGWYQEIPVSPEHDVLLSGAFWADANWTATTREMKIEYYDINYALLGSQSFPLNNVGEFWITNSVAGSAPANALWARAVVNVDGSGDEGSLQFDSMSMRLRSRPNQSFNEWSFASNPGRHTRGGWLISTGFVSTLAPRTTRAAHLLNPTANSTNGGFVQSGFLPNGIGTLSFHYSQLNLDPEASPTNPVQVFIYTSANGSSWTLRDSIPSVLNDFYIEYTRNLNLPDDRYLRIQHAGISTNEVLIDDITLGSTADSNPFQDFNSWTATNFLTNAVHTFGGWTLNTGRVTTAGAFQAISAVIAPPATATSTNVLISPLLTNGIGQISFQYARGTNGSGPVKFLVQRSENGTDWITIDTVDQIISTAYATYNRSYFFDSPHYLRIANVFIPSTGAASNLVLISEGFDAGNTAPQGWTFISISTYTSTGNFGEKSPSLSFNASNDRIIVPLTPGTTATGITFWTRGQSIQANSFLSITGVVVNGTNTSQIQIARLDGVSAIPNTALTHVVPLTASNLVELQFHYTKGVDPSGGNLAFDDLKVFGRTASSSNSPQSLLIDNINIAVPQEFRTQNFNAWPTRTTYGDYEFQGWRAALRAIIDTNNTFEGQVLRLDNSSNLSPFLQSPVLSEGIGSISFKYRHWDGSPAMSMQVQISANGENWSVLETITDITSTSFITYDRYLNTTTSFAVRIVVTAGGDRMLIDDVSITRPQPPANITLNASHVPFAPFTNDPVFIFANVSALNGAVNIGLTSFYRIGTSGVFTPLPMTLTNFIEYVSVTNIPRQPTNTIVQYFVKATFSGPGSSQTSPVFFPPGGSNSPAFYGIPRQPPGSVWINEVRYNDLFSDIGETIDSALIELAGRAGINLQGWRIDLVRTDYDGRTILDARYAITNNTILANESNGFGFWVIANPFTVERDQTLTNKINETTNPNAFLPLGIRLLNEMGGVEQAISFEGFFQGYEFVNQTDQDQSGLTSISLTGTGTNYAMFTWAITNTSAGGANGQQFFGVVTPQFMNAPDIYWAELNTVSGIVTIVTYGNTNQWNAAPYVTTNLNAAVPVWVPVTPFNSNPTSGSNNGTNRFWFALPPSATNQFFRVFYQVPPP